MFRIIDSIHFQTNIVKKNPKNYAFFEKNFEICFTLLVGKLNESMILNTFYSISFFNKMSYSMYFHASKIDVFS